MFRGNPASETPYSDFLSYKPMTRETITIQATVEMKHDCEHTSSEAFKALLSDAIVHLPTP